MRFLLPKKIDLTVHQLIEDGMKSETLEPAYSVQCYALALREEPANIQCAARLLSLLIQQERYEEIVTGGIYFEMQYMLQLAYDPRIAIPLTKAFIKLGDFSAAMDIIELVGGQDANIELELLSKEIGRQTGGHLLSTTIDEPADPPFFQRDTLRVYVDEGVDFQDLRYVE